MDYSSTGTRPSRIQNDQLVISDLQPGEFNTSAIHRIVLTNSRAAAFMNAWNPTVACDIFETQRIGFLTHAETDRINVNSGQVASAIRNFVQNEGDDAYSPATCKKALEYVKEHPSGEPEPPFPRPMFGYILKWVSEVGDHGTLDGLLTHVNRFFKPTWQEGGLYYLVNEQKSDENGNWTEVDPFTGNSAVGYARLNIFNGQRKMWTDPWTSEYVSAALHIEGVDLASGVDFLRGCWEESVQAMVITMRSWNRTGKKLAFLISAL